MMTWVFAQYGVNGVKNKASRGEIRHGPRNAFGERDRADRPSDLARLPAGGKGSWSHAARSRKPANCWLRTGCCSFLTALASIWRTRSRVTLNIRPTSSRV